MIKTYRNTTKILPIQIPLKSEVGVESPGLERNRHSITESSLTPTSVKITVPDVHTCYLAESHFSSEEAEPIDQLTHQEDSKLRLIRALIRQCADPQVRLVERVEANALCQHICQANPGFLLEQIAERIQTSPEVIQRELLRLQRQPVLKIDPFLSQLRASRLGGYQEILWVDGILPLTRNDRLLTVLAEMPCLGELVLERCRENHLPIIWCHVVPIKIRELIAYTSGDRSSY